MTTVALVGVSLAIGPEVLATGDSYRKAIEGAAARALDAAGAADARFVVFPELAGHLALYANAQPAAKRAKTVAGALAAAAARRPLDVLRGVATTRLLDARHAVLAALAPDGERWWKSIFGPLAKRYAAYVVAGSHLRLAPTGELTNASLLYGPDGRLLSTTDKVNLVVGVEDGSKHGLALARGNADALPIVQTPIGKLATLIGYDACHEAATPHERFVDLAPRLHARGGVDLVANPTTDSDGLAAALAKTPFARFGVVAHLVGEVLDLSYRGTSTVLQGAQVLASAEVGHVAATVSC